MIDAELRARVDAWLELDPDEDTRQELVALVAAAADDEVAALDLADRFDGRLKFGTAGLRAELGAGPKRMNRVVVRDAAAGLMRFLPAGATVVIGFDARHKSDLFAEDTARIVTAAGGRAWLLPGFSPTPLLAFAVRHLGADAGVMCTASHNPPRDNGYKVYLGDGAQIIPPVDAAIAAAIDEVAGTIHPMAEGFARLDGSVAAAYQAHVLRLIPTTAEPLRVVYTPMHGVGGATATAVLAGAGFDHVHPVAAQLSPDPDFPTVAFPNPEEPGALDLAVADAVRLGADLILANDPDADRLGVAVPAAPWDDASAHGWTTLTGNEIGALLGEGLLGRSTGDDRLVVTTFVSSALLARIAEHHGVHHAEVLTGFKWVVRPAIEHPEWRFVFGFEEALGFSVDPYVRDKDGIAAAAAFATLAADLRAGGRTVWDELERLSRSHGHHAARTWSVRFGGLDAHPAMVATMARWRDDPPASLAGDAVVQVTDMARGEHLPPVDAVVLRLASGGRVIARPSGTEPKVKFYFEVVGPVPDGPDGYASARAAGDTAIEALRLAVIEDLHLPD